MSQTPWTSDDPQPGDFDAEPGLSRVKTKVLAVNFADDEFYRDSLRTLQRDMRGRPRWPVRCARRLGWLRDDQPADDRQHAKARLHHKGSDAGLNVTYNHRLSGRAVRSP